MKYPIGIQDFKSIVDGGFVYVDKTALLHKMVTEGKDLLSEPSSSVWQELARLYAEVLFRWGAGAVSRSGHRGPGAGVGAISCFIDFNGSDFKGGTLPEQTGCVC